MSEKIAMNERVIEELWDAMTRRYINGEISYDEYIKQTSEIAAHIHQLPLVEKTDNKTTDRNMEEILKVLRDIKALLEQLNSKIPISPPVTPWYPIVPPQIPWYPTLPPTTEPYWVTVKVTSGNPLL